MDRQAWLIVADDLTGAADCAIAFARQGVASVVGWGDVLPSSSPPNLGPPCGPSPQGEGENARRSPRVFSYTADSRGLAPAQAASRHRDVTDRLLDRDSRLFVKIDSTLRGQPAAAIAAALDVLRARDRPAIGVLAPAFPATGRTTQDGHVHVGGAKLEQAEVWQRDHSYETADLVAMLATAGVAARTVPLATIRTGALPAALAAIPPGGVAVCDAATQDDLDRIAAASLAAGREVVFIGCAGLAHALAATTPGQADPVGVVPSANGALIVVGSLAAASRAAARDLARLDRVRYVPVAPETLLDDATPADRDRIGACVADALSSGHDVLVELLMGEHPDLAIGPRLATRLAEVLRPAAAHMSGLVATGGETAAALLAGFGVNAIRLVDELEPGVSLGLTVGAVAVPLVTKAGAFGDAGSLVRSVRRLRLIRQQGTLA
ncbi:MAG: four-carbon acid sugar kinase family protein [Acetobacteraceae bacterium]|nr:four-carbon acid sugar kinase family protein [Acetobacteraceae bacterium]